MGKSITKEDVIKTVKITKKGATVQSDKIAKVFGKSHPKVIRDIEKHIISLAKIGESDLSISKYFIEDSYINSRGKSYKRYQLTRKGFDLVVLSFTGDKAFKYNIWYIDIFHKKSEVIQENKQIAYENKENPIWLEFREQGKEIRTKLTDAVNLFLLPIRISENKETNQFVSRYISSYTNLIYKVLDVTVPKGTTLNRDAMDLRVLFKIEQLEESVAKMIEDKVGSGLGYKDCYQDIKKELLI